MAQIKNRYNRLINVAGVDIHPDKTENVIGWAGVKDGPVIKSWLAGGVLEVVSDDNKDNGGGLLPPVPVVETDVNKMTVEQLQAFLTSKNVAYSDEKKPELLALAVEASKP